MKQGDKLTLTICDYGNNGEGIAKHEGCVVFVPFAIKGETVLARIKYAKKNFANAELIKVTNPSPLRVKPPCNRFARCGGCDIMHIDYDEQTRLKQQALATTMRKNYKREVAIEQCVKSAKIFGYRNKISLPFGIVNGKAALGFFGEGTHKIVSVTKCFLHDEWAERLIAALLEYANGNNISVYDEASHTGILRHAVARYIDGKISIVLVINADNLPNQDGLTALLDKQFDNYALYYSVNKNRNNVIMGDSAVLVCGEPLSVDIKGISCVIDPMSFLQVNDEIRDQIYSRIVEKVLNNGSDALIDAYAGVGLLGAMIAKHGISVYNIEIVKEAVEDADRLASRNGVLDLVTNICGDSAIELPRLIEVLSNTKPRITVVLDPPRKGCDAAVLNALIQSASQIRGNSAQDHGINDNAIAKDNATADNSDLARDSTVADNYDASHNSAIVYNSAIADNSSTRDENAITDNNTIAHNSAAAINSTIAANSAVAGNINSAENDAIANINSIIDIVYISCNPATLSRDLAILSPYYTPVEITPYDMFPHTRHLETLVCIERK